jgi:acetate CoA/acetoacetate CoA-transferase alpha subunit
MAGYGHLREEVQQMKTAQAADIAELIPDGATLMIGGFLGAGTPSRLIDELVRRGRRELTIIANDTARPGIGIGKLVDARLVRRIITSHIGTNPQTQRQMIAGETQVELVPQGTLVERIRAGGFGLGGVLTPTGLGTLAAEGKRTIEIDGRTFLLEMPLRCDFALINARRADYLGNLEYALTSRNFNPVMAMAAHTVVAEVEEMVPVGVIPPDAVMTPHVLVNYLICKEHFNG